MTVTREERLFLLRKAAREHAENKTLKKGYAFVAGDRESIDVLRVALEQARRDGEESRRG